MLPFEFIATDLHFILATLAAAVCFATFWLYLDAWSNRKQLKEFFKWFGFATLALGFLVSSVEVESNFLSTAILGHAGLVSLILRGTGYAILIIGLGADRLQPIPKVTSLYTILAAHKENQPVTLLNTPPGNSTTPTPTHHFTQNLRRYSPLALVLLAVALAIAGDRYAVPTFVVIITALYWRRALRGLERHLKPVGWAFIWLSLFEIAATAKYWQTADDPRFYDLIASFGPIWIFAHLCLLAAIYCLGRWVWQYLTARIQTQLFMVLTTASMIIFLVVTVSFTFLLINRMQNESTAALTTTSRVLQYAIQGKLAEATASAEIIARDPAVAAAVTNRNHAQLSTLLADFLPSKKQSSLLITTDSGQVLLRGEDPSRWGDSASGDTLVARALVGQSTTGLVTGTTAISPYLSLRSAAPIRSTNGSIIGSVVVGLTADNAFTDGLQRSTGLAAAVYSGTIRVATTLLEPDGHSRATSVRETNTDITETVLRQNKVWSGFTITGGQTYLAVYAPLTDADNTPVGMLFLGQAQAQLFQAAGQSIEITFIIAAALLLIAILPLNLVARHVTRQLR